MKIGLLLLKPLTLFSLAVCGGVHTAAGLDDCFLNPPDSARPGVYWYFLDGNLNGREMTADLEFMKAAGIGNLVFLEVDIGGVPRGPVAFMSPKWQELFVQSVRDAERLGIDITLGIGPGWCGSGGPWVKPEQAMQHLVFSSVDIKGPQSYSANYQEPGPEAVIQPDGMVDLTNKLKPDGTLDWNVPAGEWTVVRMGRRVTGASSRPAPSTALGLECDKFDARAVEDHLDQYVGKLLAKIGPRAENHGLTTLHMDSWEFGAQNWTPSLLDEFKKRRGYDARVREDFTATGPVRYGHRRTEDKDIYFVANRTNNPLKVDCRFRVGKGRPQLWDPVNGKQRPLPQFEQTDGLTSVPMRFDAFQSFFVVFDAKDENPVAQAEINFPDLKPLQELTGSWDLAFDPKWGGPEKITFDTLQDWTTRLERGIKYYSGIATYRQVFGLTESQISNLKSQIFLDLGVVHDMARVRLNGKDLGVVWCAPWRIEVTDAIKAGDNSLEIEVANRWANRLIGDRQPADANARTVERPEGLLGAEPIKTGRHTFTTHDPYKNDSPLVPSGLLGPVRIYSTDR